MKKIIVTGATSMIAVAIIEESLKQNVELIYAVVRPNSKNLDRLPCDERIKIIECGISDYDKLPTLLNDSCDIFYHIAWGATGPKRNENIMEQCNNIRFTIQALHAAHELKCHKFIGAGSQAEFGLLDIERITPDSPANPIQPYGIAKYAAGKLVRAEAEKLNMSCLWVRIFSVYGKFDKDSSMISTAIRKILAGERPSFTPAEQKWDYLYSEDAGRAFYLIGKKASGNKVYCLGSGERRPLYEYIYMLRDAVNPQCDLGIGDIPYKDGTVMNLCADISELAKDTGFEPKIGFEEGIRRTVESLRNRDI